MSGAWKIRSVEFPVAVEIRYWTYLWISSGGPDEAWSSETELQSSLKALHGTLNALGMNAGGPMFPGTRIVLSNLNDEVRLDEAIDSILRYYHKSPTFLLVILRSAEDPIYSYVKTLCDIKMGVRHVCVSSHNLARARLSDTFCMNLAMKINLKLGGRNHHISPSTLGVISEGRTMVVGIDVTHPAPGTSKNVPSIAAVVASTDSFLSQWPAEISIQQGRKEMVSNLDGIMKSRLDQWAQKNGGSYPDNILIYRDGVSESQYEQVLELELPLIRRACEVVHGTGRQHYTRMRISILIVSKRHHTRFFCAGKDNRSYNPLNGTIVDRDVTQYGKWEFYLQSHSPNQGVARPVRYMVIFDEIFQNVNMRHRFRSAADHLESITHNMCYLFGRCNKAVSVCPPVFYADLACTRGRAYVSHLSEGSNPTESTNFEAENEQGNVLKTEWSRKIRLHPTISSSMFYIWHLFTGKPLPEPMQKI